MEPVPQYCTAFNRIKCPPIIFLSFLLSGVCTLQEKRPTSACWRELWPLMARGPLRISVPIIPPLLFFCLPITPPLLSGVCYKRRGLPAPAGGSYGHLWGGGLRISLPIMPPLLFSCLPITPPLLSGVCYKGRGLPALARGSCGH